MGPLANDIHQTSLNRAGEAARCVSATPVNNRFTGIRRLPCPLVVKTLHRSIAHEQYARVFGKRQAGGSKACFESSRCEKDSLVRELPSVGAACGPCMVSIDRHYGSIADVGNIQDATASAYFQNGNKQRCA